MSGNLYQITKQLILVVKNAINVVGTAQFIQILTGFIISATEAICQIYAYPCTIRNLTFNVTANANTVNAVVVSRKNGANGNLTVTITASTTGVFADNANSDILAKGDLWCLSTGVAAVTGVTTSQVSAEVDPQ